MAEETLTPTEGQDQGDQQEQKQVENDSQLREAPSYFTEGTNFNQDLILERLPEGIDPDKAKNLLEKSKNLDTLLKNNIELEAFRGQSTRIPNEDSSDEDRSKFWEQVGVPGDGKYDEIEVQGLQAEELAAFDAFAKDNNFTKGHRDAALEFFSKQVAAAQESQASLADQNVDKAIQYFSTDGGWGYHGSESFNTEERIAVATMNHYGISLDDMKGSPALIGIMDIANKLGHIQGASKIPALQSIGSETANGLEAELNELGKIYGDTTKGWDAKKAARYTELNQKIANQRNR